MARLRAVGHRERLVLAGELQGQRGRRGAGARVEGGQYAEQRRRHRAVRVDGTHPGQQLALGEGLQVAGNRRRVGAGQRPHAPGEAALRRDDVVGDATLDAAHRDRGVGRLETRVAVARLQPRLDALELADQGGSDLDGPNPELRLGGVRVLACDVGAEAIAALVRIHHLHGRGLADKHETRLGQHRAHGVDHRLDAGATDLLVVGKHDVDGLGEAAPRQLRHQGQHAGDEALHVAGAATVEATVPLGQREGIALPGLARDRHHVHVAGKPDAARPRGADGGEEARVDAVLGRDEAALDAVAREIVAHPLGHGNVRLVRRGIERDELRQDVTWARRKAGGHCSLVC